MSIDFGQLLYSGYEYGRKKLDLYGLPPNEDEGYIVLAATLAGTRVSVSYLLDGADLKELGFWLDVEHHLAYLEARREAKAERVAYDALAAKYDHQWGLV